MDDEEERKEESEKSNEASKQSMFGALRRFITGKVVGQDDSAALAAIEVSDPNFWPQIILRCRQEWSKLDNQPSIQRLLLCYDAKSMSFSDEADHIPSDSLQIQRYHPN